MRNVRALIAYDGSRFHGWQRQDGFPSVQGALEEALQALVGDVPSVHGSGRTDTGVHALGQVASFHVATRLPDERLLRALNAHLAEGVVLLDLETCPPAFHAQRDARAKRYAYRVRTTRFRPPFGGEYTHWVPEPLDLGAMRRAARHLVGRKDFSSLASSGSPRRSNVRNLSQLRIVGRRDALAFVAQSDGFLYNMMRAIAGTLLEVGRGKLDPDQVPAILASRERAAAGPTAPPGGLYLLSVLYPEPCFLGRRRGPRGAPGVFPGVEARSP
jgi:tRNA pseudouridine38-40 synthase